MKITGQYCDKCSRRLYFVSKKDAKFVCQHCGHRQKVRQIEDYQK